MTDMKTIAIIGATGAQGGGLAQAILADQSRTFRVRAITRNIASDKAKAMAEAGAELIKADLDDIASLVNAFTGVYGVYAVTNFWEHFSAEKEVNQAGNIAQAAKQTRVKQVIWSTLEDTRNWVPLNDDRMPTLKDKYKVPHFDGKGEANQVFFKADVPVTLLLTSFYWDNFIHFGMGPKEGPDGVLALTLPMADKKLPGIAAEDIGKCALGIFKKGDTYIGKTVGIAGEHLTGTQMANLFGKALGREVRYNVVSPEIYRQFGFPGADDLGNMFQFKCDFESYFCGARDPEFTRLLNPELQSFATWLAKNKNRIPLK